MMWGDDGRLRPWAAAVTVVLLSAFFWALVAAAASLMARMAR